MSCEDSNELNKALSERRNVTVGRVEELPCGQGATVELRDGSELALFNVDGEFFAISNFCPHMGAPLAGGTLRGHTIQCEWHGWEFDVRTGKCLTTNEDVESYPVRIEDGEIKIDV